MSVNKIENHVEAGLDRLIEQYKCAPAMESILRALLAGFQDLEDAGQELELARDVFTATGTNLDKIGEIVGQGRLGFDDDFYRILLLVKIAKNTSEGTPEQIIEIYRLITQADTVHLQDLVPGNVYLSGDGKVNPITVNFLYTLIQDIVAAGVRVAYLGEWDENCAFTFDGDPQDGQGFGDANDPSVGGCLAFLYDISIPFVLDGESDGLGLGDVNDPVLGGAFQSA